MLAVGLTDRFVIHLLLVLVASVGSAAFHPSAAGTAGGLSSSRQGVALAVYLVGGYDGFAVSQLAFAAAYRRSPGARRCARSHCSFWSSR